MLHSNGSIPQTHYDMNLPFMDELMRHLLWTGDLQMAKATWPVIQRHLAYEKRLFDRDGLYEGYACIWASDGLKYNGGGTAHSSAYNFFHNQMAARLAKLIGEDPTPYEKEAQRIHDAMEQQLWLADRGWFGEYKDLLGLKRVHPDAALWSIYHAIDSLVPDAFQQYQLLRYVDTQIAHIPVRGNGVPAGDWFQIPESNWLPYEWSLNNVVTGESAHTALAFWQGGQPEKAWRLWMGMILDAMYMGRCPGDLPNLSQYDANRGETYRDFGDAVGITSRSLIEGLFGIAPDALAGEVTIRPGFPSDWDHASIRTPDIFYSFQHDADGDHYMIEPKFAKPMKVKLICRARGDRLDAVRVNEQEKTWHCAADSVGQPWITIECDDAPRWDVDIRWSGEAPTPPPTPRKVDLGGELEGRIAPATVIEVRDPQNALSGTKTGDHEVSGSATGTPGHRTVFAKVGQGDLAWWLPIDFEICEATSAPPPLPRAAVKFQTIDLSGLFNDQVTQIFRNRYLSPRSPYCSLEIPIQGIGTWSSPRLTADIDDSGLRRAAKNDMLMLPGNIPIRTPMTGKNIAFTSQWDNYPREISVALSGSASHAWLMLAGSTNPMQTQIDNGEIVVAYADGTSQRLALRNPDNWWPIEQDYFTDDFAFRRDGPNPLRVELGTGRIYVPKGDGHIPAGGAATVLDLPLNSGKSLKSLTVRSLSNEVVIGLMSLTLAR